MADLPKDEEGLKRWCEDRWVEKDERLGEMVKHELGDGAGRSAKS